MPREHDSADATGQTPQGGPEILLLSGWNLYNIGDVAHTPGFLQLAADHVPEAHVTVLASRFGEELRAYLRPRYPDCDVIPMEFEAGRPLSRAMENAFARADLLVLNSGMALSFGYHGRDWDHYMPRLAAFLKARTMNIPYGVWAHSFDLVETPADIMYRDLFSTAAFLYTRESESLKLLDRIGVRAHDMGFCPDSAFAFHYQVPDKASQFLAANQLDDGNFLVVVPRLDVFRFRDDQRELFHAQQTADLISSWVRTTGLPAVIMHERLDGVEDARRLIYDGLPPKIQARVEFQPDYWMPEDCQYVFARARVIVSFEMHSVILGLAVGVPSIHPYFAEAGLKQWMMRDLGLEGWMFDQDEVHIAEVASTVEAVADDDKASRARAEEAGRRAASIQAERMAVLREVMNRHKAQPTTPGPATR